MSADEWIVGNGAESEREYVIHTSFPRFIARVVATDEDGLPLEPDDAGADLLSGVVWSGPNGEVLCEVEWIDTPEPGTIRDLLSRAAAALEIFTQDAEEAS